MRTLIISLAALAYACTICAQSLNLDDYKINVENEWAVNTKHSEFGMVKSTGGQYMFTSDRNKFSSKNAFLGDASYKMYTCSLNKDYQTVRPSAVGYNATTNNGPATPVRNNTFYFTSTNKKATLNWKEGTSSNTLTISKATLVNGKWKTKVEKAFKSKKHSYGQPSLSADGKTLYFISNMEGGYGGTDIYVSHLGPEGWSAPQNLGPEVNTAENDMYPFIHDSGILFFASEGHRGFGGLDIFMTYKTTDGWASAENMGSPVNTPADDFSVYFAEDFNDGFFSSNRMGGKGGDDIYRVSLEQMVTPMSASAATAVPGAASAITAAPVLGDMASDISEADTAPPGLQE